MSVAARDLVGSKRLGSDGVGPGKARADGVLDGRLAGHNGLHRGHTAQIAVKGVHVGEPIPKGAPGIARRMLFCQRLDGRRNAGGGRLCGANLAAGVQIKCLAGSCLTWLAGGAAGKCGAAEQQGYDRSHTY